MRSRRTSPAISTPACEYWPVEEVSPIRGHHALTGWIERWLEAWDDAWDVVEEIIEDGELVVAATRVYGRGRRSGMEISQRLFDVFELRDGKVLRVTEYLDREGAFQAAGLVQPQAVEQIRLRRTLRQRIQIEDRDPSALGSNPAELSHHAQRGGHARA